MISKEDITLLNTAAWYTCYQKGKAFLMLNTEVIASKEKALKKL